MARKATFPGARLRLGILPRAYLYLQRRPPSLPRHRKIQVGGIPDCIDMARTVTPIACISWVSIGPSRKPWVDGPAFHRLTVTSKAYRGAIRYEQLVVRWRSREKMATE